MARGLNKIQIIGNLGRDPECATPLVANRPPCSRSQSTAAGVDRMASGPR
jgi:hypothetical protein